MPIPRPKGLIYVAAICLGLCAIPAHAWTPTSQERVADEAARLVPPDLYRQLVRNRAAYLQGTREPFKDRTAEHHSLDRDSGGLLEQVIARAIDDAISTIKAHQPFNHIAYRLGIVSHYVADANNPLAVSDADPQEARFAGDFLAYLESTKPRVEVVFYGFRPNFRGSRDLPRLLAETFARGRGFYPLVGREYRRIKFQDGRRHFDDRSTAYAVAALSFSHAVSDIAEVLRYIWIEAGGVDTRTKLPIRGQHVMPLPKTNLSR